MVLFDFNRVVKKVSANTPQDFLEKEVKLIDEMEKKGYSLESSQTKGIMRRHRHYRKAKLIFVKK